MGSRRNQRDRRARRGVRNGGRTGRGGAALPLIQIIDLRARLLVLGRLLHPPAETDTVAVAMTFPFTLIVLFVLFVLFMAMAWIIRIIIRNQTRIITTTAQIIRIGLRAAIQ